MHKVKSFSSMSLSSGARFGPYVVFASIGATTIKGISGTVWVSIRDGQDWIYPGVGHVFENYPDDLFLNDSNDHEYRIVTDLIKNNVRSAP